MTAATTAPPSRNGRRPRPPAVPSDFGCENALLGTVLLHPDAIPDALAAGVEPDYFWAPAARSVWAAAVALHDRGATGAEPISAELLAAELRRTDDANSIASDRIVAAQAAGGRPHLVPSLASELRRHALRREIKGRAALADDPTVSIDELCRPLRFGVENGPVPPAIWPVLDAPARHGLAGEVLEVIDPHTEADPVALLIAFLVCFGAAVGPSPHAVADGAQHPARLFGVLVGDTSKARKSSAVSNVMRVFAAAEPRFATDRVLGGFGSGEALIDVVKDGEDPRALVLEHEFARILNVGRRDGATLSPIIRQAWDGGRLQVRARSGTVVASGAHVGILGMITVDELRARLTDTELASGFANRHLFALVRRSKRLPSGGNREPA